MNLPFGFTLQADFSGDGYLFLALLFIGSAFAFLMNKPRHYSQSGFEYLASWIIPALRILALIILLLLLFAPQLTLNRRYSIPKRLAVIIDESSSMRDAWQGNAEDLQKSITQTIQSLENASNVDVWTMAGQKINIGSVAFTDQLSVFNWIPPTIDDPESKDAYSTVFLFSDGHLNGGRSPLDMEWSKSFPVNVVYPLKPKSNASLKIIDVSYSFDEGPNQGVLIEGKLQQEGLLGRQASVEILSEKDQLLGEEIIQLNQTFQDLKVLLGQSSKEVQQVKIRLSLQGGDLLSENSLKIAQKKTKKNVLILSERINRLHKFLVQSFSDSTYAIHTLLGTFREKEPRQAAAIPEDIDLIILNHPGAQVFEAISHSKFAIDKYTTTPSILFYDGIETLDPKWIEWLGVKVSDVNEARGPQNCYWSDISKEHPFYLGILGQGYIPGELMNYAPIAFPSYSVDSAGDQLLTLGYGSSSTAALRISDKPPRAIFSGGGYWKWFFHPQSKNSFRTLWEYLLVYLEEIASFKPVKIDVPVQTAATGAYIKTDIKIKDLDARIIKVAELRVWQEDEEGKKTTLDLTADERGVYQTVIDTKRPGEVVVIAEAYRFGELWGRDTSRIELMSFNGEDQSRGVDEVFLSRLASRSGGQVIQIGEDELPNIPVEMVARESSYQYKGLRSPILFAVLFLLLTFEWIWRRRSGLL